MDEYRLQVDASQLIKALKIARKFIKTQKEGSAYISYQGGQLVIALPGVHVNATAEGNWPMPVRTSVALIRMLAQVPPAKKGTVTLRFDGQRIGVGDTSMPAETDQSATPPIDVLATMSLRQILRLRSTHTDDEIRKSGYANTVQKAEQRLDRCLTQAAKALNPLDVSAVELRDWIEAKLRD